MSVLTVVVTGFTGQIFMFFQTYSC